MTRSFFNYTETVWNHFDNTSILAFKPEQYKDSSRHLITYQLATMQTKNILIGLLSLTAIAEASAIYRPFEHIMNRRSTGSLQGRQDANNGRFGSKYLSDLKNITSGS